MRYERFSLLFVCLWLVHCSSADRTSVNASSEDARGSSDKFTQGDIHNQKPAGTDDGAPNDTPDDPQDDPQVDLDDDDGAKEPVLTTGAALICITTNSTTTYCKFDGDVTDLEEYTWNIYDIDGQPMDEDQYSVRNLGEDAVWDIVVEFEKPISAVLIEAYTLNEDDESGESEKVVSSINVTAKVSLNARLSGTYATEYGDLDLMIDETGYVSGSYSYDGYDGSIEGTFDGETMTIEGRYHESKDRKILFFPIGKDVEEGDFIFQYELIDGKVGMKRSEYREDGSSNWEPWDISL